MSVLFQLFFAFIQVGLFSVGGGYAAIPLIQNQIVDIHKLMTLGEFTDLITIAEMTPGPISINSATFVGTRLAGIPGAVLCTLGCIIPSFIICLTLAHFYYKYRNFSGVQTVLSALRPAGCRTDCFCRTFHPAAGTFHVRPVRHHPCKLPSNRDLPVYRRTLPSAKIPRQCHRYHLWYRCGGHPCLFPARYGRLKTLYQKKLSCFRRAFLFYST